jgi:phosphoadenosine phosphosulfate reductase
MVTARPQVRSLPSDHGGQPVVLESAREDLADRDAYGRLLWALDTFADGLAVTTSFGIQSAVLLHLVSRLAAERGQVVPVVWVDTGYLPAETYRYAEQLRELLRIDLHVAQAEMSPARMEALHGRLWETGRVEDMELYHRIRKVEPLDRALAALGVSCWASGVRGSQTDHRRSMAVLDGVRQRWALRPLLSWTNRDVYYYMEEHALPQHPLFEQGYSTVGDWHSSAPDSASLSGRETRFGGLKQECGIHLPGLMGEGI